MSMELTKYNGILAAHDWYYAMSDDSRVYEKGLKSARHIERLSKISEQHTSLYNAYRSYHFSGPHFNREQKPKAKLAFWYHGESDGYFVTTDANEYEIYAEDIEVDEIDENKYLELEKKNGN